jgi:HEAT repeat protein
MMGQPDQLIGKLIQMLHDPDVATRRNAAGALRLHGERAVYAIPDLMRLLETDEDETVRDEARRALNRLARAVA